MLCHIAVPCYGEIHAGGALGPLEPFNTDLSDVGPAEERQGLLPCYMSKYRWWGWKLQEQRGASWESLGGGGDSVNQGSGGSGCVLG